MAAEWITYDNTGMSAINRCDRCGGQAYVEVALDSGGTLLFCCHHTNEHEEALKQLEATIADHRPFLLKQERGTRDAAAAPK